MLWDTLQIDHRKLVPSDCFVCFYHLTFNKEGAPTAGSTLYTLVKNVYYNHGPEPYMYYGVDRVGKTYGCL